MVKRQRRRRPHSPTRERSLGIALVIARRALAGAHKQLPTMNMPQGVDRVEVTLEVEKLMVAMESRLRRITGPSKDAVVK